MNRAAVAGDGVEPEMRVDLYRTMVLIRRFEEEIRFAYHDDKGPAFDIGAGLVPGEMHLAAGQEPVAAGVCTQLTAGDAVTGSHRAHHLAIAHGVDLHALAAEIFGRVGGLCRGRGGHMHLVDPDRHFSSSGIVTAGYTSALGRALAFQRAADGHVAVAVTGEGAADRRAFDESLHLASSWRLPVVFVVEDNGWASSAPRRSTIAASNLVRAAAYGMPAECIEENAVEAVYEAAGHAVTRARAGAGPTLIEVRTVRLWGHAEGDPQDHRDDLDALARRDPLPIHESRLRGAGLLDDAGVRDIAAEAQRRVVDAIDFARSSPEPEPATALDHVFT